MSETRTEGEENITQEIPVRQETISSKKKRYGCIACGIIAALAFAGGSILIFVFLMGTIIFGTSEIASLLKLNPYGNYQEIFVEGDDLSMNKIAIIDVKGIIVDGASSFYEVADATYISDLIKYITHDGSVKAVVLDIDSPGGEVVASDTIHHAIQRLREETGIPIVSVMRSLGASGAYYVAAGSDYIIANRLTTTGSIGVIIETYKYYDLFKKIGLEGEVFKSGAMKDILNGTRPTTPAEKALVQNLVEKTYLEFVKIVASGRKNLSVEKIRNSIIGDGRIFDGAEAFNLGLVDQLGFFDDALRKAAELAELEDDYKAVRYQEPFSFANLFRSSEASSSLNLSLEGGAKRFSLEKGRLYFLPNSLF